MAVEVPGVEGAVPEARELYKAPAVAAEAVAALLDVEVADVEVTVVVLP